MSSKPDKNWRIEVIKDWWQKMQPDDTYKQRLSDRASLARLRRCRSIDNTLTEPAAVALARRCKIDNDNDLMRIGLVASVLSHVRYDAGEISNARTIGPSTQDDESSAKCKTARFRRLLAKEDVEECQVAFRRLVALMGCTANVSDLAESLMDWPIFFGQEERSKRRRVRWVYDYWNIGASGEG